MAVDGRAAGLNGFAGVGEATAKFGAGGAALTVKLCGTIAAAARTGAGQHRTR